MDGQACTDNTSGEMCVCVHGVAWHFCESLPPSGYGEPPASACVVRPTISWSSASCEEDICEQWLGLLPCTPVF